MKNLIEYIILCLLFFVPTSLFGQNQDLLNNFLTVDNGLSHNEVISIVQDHDGFIWIGTRGGLNRYDGYDFKIFNQIPGDSNSLVNPSIESLFIDRKGNIWIGTKSGGVSKYNPVTGIFRNITSNYQQSSSVLPDNRILKFYEDKLGRIWMGTWGNGLIIYDEAKDSAKHYLGRSQVNSIVGTPDDRIWVGGRFMDGLFEYIEESDTLILRSTGAKDYSCMEMQYDEKRNVIWIVSGNYSGLIKFDLRNYKQTRYKIDESEEQEIHQIESIWIDNYGAIWVGTWGTGLYVFDPEKEIFKRHLLYPEIGLALNKDYDVIPDIFQDRNNTMWLGTNGGGLCVLSKKMGFNSIGYHPQLNKGLINTRLMSVLEDRKGNLWLGTIGSGLVWSPDRENFYPVSNSFVDKSIYFVVKYIYEDNSGNVWVGTNLGVFLIDFINDIPELVKAETKFAPIDVSCQPVSFLDAEGMFWIGSLESGLFLYDKNDNYSFKKQLFKNDKEAGNLNDYRISYLLQDSKERIWIGTYNGLHIYNKKDTTILVAEDVFNISGNFTGNIITCLDEDLMGNIWVGTPNGLNKLTETGENKFSIEYYTQKDGLASNFIKGIVHDLSGNVWASTNVGISKFKTKEEEFINFDESDGVLGKSFTEASVFRNLKGELFFGGTAGLTYFSPKEIVEYSLALKPVFTELSVLNEPIEIGKEYDSGIILEKAISQTNVIELSYRQNKVEIQFSALDYPSNGRNTYQYILENYDLEWTDLGTRRYVTFNNLKPATYVLRVKSSNRHNVWNEDDTSIKIIIKPPFWQTWYALVLYILVIVGIVSIIRRNAVKQVRLANSLEMEKVQHEQDQKINELKLRFFTNLSHEFRTPLTLILAPLKELLSKEEEYEISEEAGKKIHIVQKNSQRLMKLVNQLLDFRKVESGSMKLHTNRTNLDEFVAEVCHPFFELARINSIIFKLNSSLKSREIWVDRDKLEIIINNLISNAFKYAGGNREIEVALFEEEEEVLICVSDNGPGIPSAEIKNIFDRFYRVGKEKNLGSTGIGLALAKRFAELHHGTISVVSEPNIHTEFTVCLPKGKNHLKSENIVGESEYLGNPEIKGQTSRAVLKEQARSKSEESILIVEDNPEINDYLVNLLEPMYEVHSASEGADGFEKAKELIPNLILSDIMMPGVDGFEFCKKIRSNERTATVPFIFLTAKNDEQYKLLGTQLGADDFISKPFDPNLLLEKIKNILASRKKLQKQYSKSILLGPSEIEITSGEEKFIEKMVLTIENNLQNHNFSSEILASEMNMSNSSLYRKLKSLTGSSTAEFIRSIRIKRAAQLLADKERTITEISYEVGFNDVKHFRTVFQKQFACSPSEFRKKQ